ncbi:MAG: Uncharacterized protein LiPW16_201 [Microgenomates group bacterium LiPW_16]|nr:MAG: Uncharacterized protein LiPW16_201 [Microgenomates group bacterium LiPW_16]
MITILHGESILASRSTLAALKAQHKDKEILILDGKKIGLTEVKQALETSSMFTVSRLVIIENLLSGRKDSNQQEILAYLGKNLPRFDLILWEKEEVSKSLLARVSPAKVLLFKPEPVLFKFLESIRPDNKSQALKLLEQSFKRESPEIIFYMLVRQFRFLLLLKDGVTSGVEELDRLASWQKERLARQAKHFSLEQLVEIYQKLLEIDYQQKTGQAAFNLTKTLELFLTNL